MARYGINAGKFLDLKAKALDISSKAVTHCREDEPVRDVIPLLQRHRRLPVLSETGGYFRSVVSGQDVLDFLGGGEKYLIYRTRFDGLVLPVGKIATRKALHLTPEHTAGDALSLLQRHGKGFHPILEYRKVSGILTEWDMVKHIDGKTGMRVRDAMTHRPAFIRDTETVFDAVKAMVRGGYRRLPVVTGHGRDPPLSPSRRLAGIVTPKDILKHLSATQQFHRLAKDRVGITRAISGDAASVAPGQDVAEAVRLMASHGVNCLPVVNTARELVGIITEKDIVDVMR
ncbi:MAG: CBS domain-containing protein [Candidatus Aenigmarchaeota archaeon]|nr:CBS domain-containing protein [Candidatus Aenigmarchaeota archaeon]